MSSREDHTGNSEKGDKFIYWCFGALALILVVIGLVEYRGAKQDDAADQKAEQLISALQKAGVERLPSTDQVARVLGTDGGSVCQDPNHGLRKATLFSMMSNGAAGPGMRPIVTDRRLLRGQLAVIAVYCPDELPDFQHFVDNLRTGNVVRG
jgi:hypothetical protein